MVMLIKDKLGGNNERVCGIRTNDIFKTRN